MPAGGGHCWRSGKNYFFCYCFFSALALFLAAEDFAGSGRFAERSEREAPLFRPGRGAGFAALLVAELFRFEAPGRCWARARFLVV